MNAITAAPRCSVPYAKIRRSGYFPDGDTIGNVHFGGRHGDWDDTVTVQTQVMIEVDIGNETYIKCCYAEKGFTVCALVTLCNQTYVEALDLYYPGDGVEEFSRVLDGFHLDNGVVHPTTSS
jgi:hypothetical protein